MRGWWISVEVGLGELDGCSRRASWYNPGMVRGAFLACAPLRTSARPFELLCAALDAARQPCAGPINRDASMPHSLCLPPPPPHTRPHSRPPQFWTEPANLVLTRLLASGALHDSVALAPGGPQGRREALALVVAHLFMRLPMRPGAPRHAVPSHPAWPCLRLCPTAIPVPLSTLTNTSTSSHIQVLRQRSRPQPREHRPP